MPKAAQKTVLAGDLTQSPKDRRGDFVRLAEARCFRAVEQLRLIGNLSNTSGYDWTQADLDKVFGAIENEVAAAKARFVAAGQKVRRQPVKLGA